MVSRLAIGCIVRQSTFGGKPGSGSRVIERSTFVIAEALVVPPVEQLAISVLCHPSGASEMAVVDLFSAMGIGVGIDVKENRRDFAPVGTFSSGIEQAHV